MVDVFSLRFLLAALVGWLDGQQQSAANGRSWTSISAGTPMRVNGNKMSQPSKPDPVDL